jgi:hypothetical protein
MRFLRKIFGKTKEKSKKHTKEEECWYNNFPEKEKAEFGEPRDEEICAYDFYIATAKANRR